MIKEYYNFIKRYLNLIQIKKKHIYITIITAVLYKSFSLALPFIGAMIIKYISIGNFNMSYISLLIFAVVYLLYNVSLMANYKLYGFNMKNSYYSMQTRILNKLLTVDDGFTRKIPKGRLMNSINKEVIDIGDAVDQISEFLTTIIQIVGLFAIVVSYNVYLALIFLIYAFVYIKVSVLADRNVILFHQKVKHDDDFYSSLLSQMLSGLQEIKTFDMFSKMDTKLKRIQKSFSKNYLTKRHSITLRDNDIRFITHLCRIILYFFLIFLMMKEKITIDVLVLIISYHEYLVDYLDDFLKSAFAIREVDNAVTRINDILNYKCIDNMLYGDNPKDDIVGKVEFRDVVFSIGDKKILNKFNLKVKPNTVTAIVGESGSGKTSIINLLLRLYKVNEGKILIDDIDIYDYTKEVYSSNVSVVNQKPFIFNMSIKKNLDFVDKNIERQIEACKRVGIHDFIMSLPKNYHTVLRENANNISGGQKQLISIARTLLSTSEVLLLDDISTSLDPDTAKMIPKLLKELKKDHTIIMVTKKPELMKVADRIIVLGKGRVVGDGKHNDLIKTNITYQLLNARKSPSRIGGFTND